jgi:phosphatidylserine decarboxylase
MEAGLWKLAMRTADYYGTTPDAREVQVLVERMANEFVEELRQKMGAEYGFIKFGSRIDLFLPLDAEICVEMNQKTVGGETIVAKW